MDLFTDYVTIRRSNGDEIKDVKCSIQTKIHIPDVTVPVEEGDIIEQELPSGITKKMLVTGYNVYANHGRLNHISIEYTRA